HPPRRTLGAYPVALLPRAAATRVRERPGPEGQSPGPVAIPSEQLDRDHRGARTADPRGLPLRAPRRGSPLGRVPADRRDPPHDVPGELRGPSLREPSVHGGELGAGQRDPRLRDERRGGTTVFTTSSPPTSATDFGGITGIPPSG